MNFLKRKFKSFSFFVTDKIRCWFLLFLPMFTKSKILTVLIFRDGKEHEYLFHKLLSVSHNFHLLIYNLFTIVYIAALAKLELCFLIRNQRPFNNLFHIFQQSLLRQVWSFICQSSTMFSLVSLFIKGSGMGKSVLVQMYTFTDVWLTH